MCKVYQKLGDTPLELLKQKAFREKLERVDSLVKSSLLDKLCSNMNNQCAAKSQQILYSIDALYALNKVRHLYAGEQSRTNLTGLSL